LKKIIKKITSLFLLVALIAFYSCNDNAKESTSLNIKLVDKPADFAEVNVEVIGVSINYGAENDENGWQELETSTGV